MPAAINLSAYHVFCVFFGLIVGKGKVFVVFKPIIDRSTGDISCSCSYEHIGMFGKGFKEKALSIFGTEVFFRCEICVRWCLRFMLKKTSVPKIDNALDRKSTRLNSSH